MESKSILVYFIHACPSVLAAMKRAAGEFSSYEMPKEWNHFASLVVTLADINSRSSQYTDDSPLISKKPIVDSGEEEGNLKRILIKPMLFLKPSLNKMEFQVEVVGMLLLKIEQASKFSIFRLLFIRFELLQGARLTAGCFTPFNLGMKR